MTEGHNYLNHGKGLKSWLTTLDHKRIGVMYLFSVLFFFLVGGIFALMIRANLFLPAAITNHAASLAPNNYNKVMTYHGAIMVFLVFVVATAEIAVAIPIVLLLVRRKRTLDLEAFSDLKG